ncbi:MAG TPA: hypothetical protein VN848_06285 [Gemmatimonadales bacterium]|nr:hypothetical protein [Gemmatimonadales bacterium]
MRIVILAASLLTAAACTMRTDVPAPSTYIAANHPSAIWVETQYPTVRLEHPDVVGDSIVGTRDGRPFSVALSGVTGATVRQIDWPATDALIAMGAAATLFFVVVPALKSHAANSEVPCPGPCIPGQISCCPI